MYNTLQVKSIFTTTPEELQDELNKILVILGKRVQNIDFISPLSEGFAANVTYWSQDVPAAITAKLEESVDELPKDAALFVAVITDEQRAWVENALSRMALISEQDAKSPENNAATQDALAREAKIYRSIAGRFDQEHQED